MKSFPKISVIISNFNGSKLNILEDCLKSFINLDYPNYELILVDNASTDDSIKVAQKIFKRNPKFKVIKNTINMYSLGINLGFENAKGEYIALFNNDVLLEKGFLENLVRAFEKYPKLGVAQGKLLWFYDNSVIDSAGEAIDLYGNPVTLGYQTKDNGLFDKDEEILSASGAACLIRKSALAKVGGYDPDFGIGYEDMDHGLRFRTNGYTIMRIPSAVCYHKRGVTDLSSQVRVKVRWHFNKNRLATMIRNYPMGLLVKSLPVTILIYLGSMVWEVLSLRSINLGWTRLEAMGWIVANLPKLVKDRSEIRKKASSKTDKAVRKFFAKTDLIGKVKAVIMDGLSKSSILKDFQYSLPLTYPALIKALIPPGSSILDVGCGDGNVAAWINYKNQYNIVGIDINEDDLAVARGRKTKNKQNVYKDLLLEDLTKRIPFKKKFDIVLCSQVVEHLEKEKSWELIRKMEKLAKQRVIVATINGFFQFNHRFPGKHDVHLSGWSAREFTAKGYKVQGSGLRIIYKPGALKDNLPKYFHPFLFIVSYISTPILKYFTSPALLLIAHKDVNNV